MLSEKDENKYYIIYHKTTSIFIDVNMENKPALEFINHSKRELSTDFVNRVRFETSCENFEEYYGYRAENDYRNGENYEQR